MNVLIIDENPIFRRGLCSLIRERVNNTFEFETLSEIATWCKSNLNGLSILFIDNSLAMNKLSFIEEHLLPIKHLKCVSMLGEMEQPFSRNLIRKGFLGAIKRMDIDEIIKCIDAVNKERIYISSDILSSILGVFNETEAQDDPMIMLLNDKEKSILQLTYEEYSAKQIADKLSLSTRTVEWYRKKMMEKTGAKNMIGLIRFGIETRILSAAH